MGRTINISPFEEWKIAFGDAIGLSHEERNIVCQDKVSFFEDQLIKSISLADGAGSCKNSDLGAEKITKIISEVSVKSFDKLYHSDEKELKIYYKDIIQNTLQTTSKEHHTTIKDLSSTLLFVATDGSRYIIGHIGDGAIATISNKQIKTISSPANIDFDNITYFTTHPDLEKHLRIKKGDLENIDGFILMSDGSMDGLYQKSENKFSNVLFAIYEWFKIYSSNDVSKAISKNLHDTIRYKTTDDCSLAFLVKLSDMEKIQQFSELEKLQTYLDTHFDWSKII